MKEHGQEERDREIARRISGGERVADVARSFGIGATWARAIATREARASGEAERLAKPELLAALKRCHGALDQLFAMLVEAYPGAFFPSKSGEPWDAMVAAHELIKRLEG